MSLTSDDLADIKQLMQAVVYQSNAAQKDEIMQEVRKELQGLREEMDDRFEEQDGKLDVILDAIGTEFIEVKENISDLDTRVKRLEAKPA